MIYRLLLSFAMLAPLACTDANFSSDTKKKTNEPAKPSDDATKKTPNDPNNPGGTNCTDMDAKSCKQKKADEKSSDSFRDVDCSKKDEAGCEKLIKDQKALDGDNKSEIVVKNCEPKFAQLCSTESTDTTKDLSTSDTTSTVGDVSDSAGSKGPVTGDITEGDGATLNEVVTRVEVNTTIDHDSYLVIKNNKIYWRHLKLGIPQSTTVNFYSAKGLINTKTWTPKFKDGRGPNCNGKFTMRATLYCENDCECWSEAITFGKGSKLTGDVTNFTGRGTKTKTGEIEIHLYDPQSGASAYSFHIE